VTAGNASRAGARSFAGFPSRAQSTAIPNVFFSDLLPQLTASGALAVALCALHAIGRRRGFPRYVEHDELAADCGLTSHLSALGDPSALLSGGLARAVDVGVLLSLAVEAEDGRRDLYFMNAPADRRGMEAVRRGDSELGRPLDPPVPPGGRTSLYAMYESLIGTLGPGMAEELAEAERLYPPEWLQAAFREAAAQNARSWRYISRILERWASEGRGDAKTHGDPAHDDRYFAGKYGSILRRRLEG
jgi:DnaD/phage-associated family protein